MCGVTSETISPSVRSTSRSTPCVLGCCGPMLTSISSVRTSNSMIRGSSNWVDIGQLSLSPLLAANSMVFQRHLVVFSQGMADPIFRAQNPPQVGMAGEIHSAQVVDFAFVPIRRAPNAADAGDLGNLARNAVFPTGQNHLKHEAGAMRHAPKM